MNLQELKKMAESVNALSIKVYPILDDGTKKKVKEQGTGYCWRCHKDIKKSIDTLKEAKKEKKEKKGQWISHVYIDSPLYDINRIVLGSMACSTNLG